MSEMRPLTQEEAQAFAHEWIEAWNSHDLQRILSHYSDDFEMTSPYIRSMAKEPSGCLKGKSAVGAYWREALEKLPDLEFRLISVLWGPNSIVIHYQSSLGNLAAEVLMMESDRRVKAAFAHYDSV